MDLTQIKMLATQGESQQLEYKKSTSNLKDILQTICAFLNCDGGSVLIGVEDNGNLVGQDVADKTKREIGIEIAKIAPYSNSSIEIFYVPFLGNKKIIVFHVTTDSTKTPYTYNGRAYIRVQSDTLPMPSEYYQHLTLNNTQFKDKWEDEGLTNITLDDLDTEEIISTIKEGVLNGRIPEGYATKDPEKALRHLGLLQDNQITRAALILFGKSPETILPQCILRLARFKGTDKSEFIDNKQIHGNVFKLIRSALSFAHMHLPIASTFSKTSIKREDIPLFPLPILREAITNALCHREYRYTGGSISFAIYDDRVEIWSYGLLPPGLSIDDLGGLNQSIPRNRRIANVLYYHKLFESWGRGIRLILDGCVEAGHPTPVYSISSGGLLLMMPSISTRVTEPPLKPTDYEGLTARQREIIVLLEKTSHGLSTTELHSQLSSPPTERWIRNELNKLKASGYINSAGSTTTKKWYIKK